MASVQHIRLLPERQARGGTLAARWVRLRLRDRLF